MKYTICNMTNMLPQTPKNQPSSQENINDNTQNLAKLEARKSKLQESIAMIIAQRGGNEAELVGTPFYDIRAAELKKIEADIAEILTTGDIMDIDPDAQDFFESEEFTKLIDSLPGEYVENPK